MRGFALTKSGGGPRVNLIVYLLVVNAAKQDQVVDLVKATRRKIEAAPRSPASTGNNVALFTDNRICVNDCPINRQSSPTDGASITRTSPQELSRLVRNGHSGRNANGFLASGPIFGGLQATATASSRVRLDIVTQLVISLLRLIVFPYEWAKQTGVGKECIERSRLNDLALEGWPKWDFSVGRSETIGQLLHRVRNALAHRHVGFSSESRLLSETYISFHDRRDESAPLRWEATIRADHLVTFVRRFAELLPSCID
jgi:hypothetical protein